MSPAFYQRLFHHLGEGFKTLGIVLKLLVVFVPMVCMIGLIHQLIYAPAWSAWQLTLILLCLGDVVLMGAAWSWFLDF